MKKQILTSLEVLGFVFLFLGQAFGQVGLNTPTISWTPILFGGTNQGDAGNDASGNAEYDIVGNAANPSLYTKFSNGTQANYADATMSFRLRLGGDSGRTGFKGSAYVGLDANLDGSVDLFLGVNNLGGNSYLGVWYPGAGLNNSPATTSLSGSPLMTFSETSLNYGFIAVSATTDPRATSYDLNGNRKTDQFLSFSVPFASIIAALAARGINNFTPNSLMQLMALTAGNGRNSIRDLNGVAGGRNSSGSWTDLGGFSVPGTPGGLTPATPVPEPSTACFCLMGSFILLCVFRRRAHA